MFKRLYRGNQTILFKINVIKEKKRIEVGSVETIRGSRTLIKFNN